MVQTYYNFAEWLNHYSPLFLICAYEKDIADLDGGKVATIDFPNANDLTKFFVSVSPDTGYWKGAKYDFEFAIPDHYVSSSAFGLNLVLQDSTVIDNFDLRISVPSLYDFSPTLLPKLLAKTKFIILI